MQRLAFVLAATVALAAPASAQSLSVLLPSLSFPETIVTPSTMDCGTDQAPASCQLPE